MCNGKNTEEAFSGGTSAAAVGNEAHLWQIAVALRGITHAAEYMHDTLGRRMQTEKHWQYGTPPAGNVDFV